MEEQDERGGKSATGPSPRSSAAQAPAGFDLEHRERSGCPGRLKSSLLDAHRVPFDVGELLRFEGTFVHAEDQGGPSQRNLLVHVLQEVEDPREVVVDHEVLDSVQQDDRPWRLVQEVPDQVAQVVQIVRIDVVLAQRRREPHDADVLVALPADHVIRMLPRDVERTPAGVDRLLKHHEGPLRLLLLDEVGPSLLEVLLFAEKKVLEKLVLLESEQERPWKRPHGTSLLSGGPILYVSYRLSTLRLISVAERSTATNARSSAAGWNLYRGSAVRPTPWRPPSSESSEDPPSATRSSWRRNRRGSSSPHTERRAIRRGSGCTRACRWPSCRAMGRITGFHRTS